MSVIFERHLLAHRGLWGDSAPANSPTALARALQGGFGIETDLRDRDGRVVVSHDPPGEEAEGFLESLSHWKELSVLNGAALALNIKSDGLLPLLSTELACLTNTHYFFFDMSFPQMREFSRAGQPIATRVSEYEPLDLSSSLHIGSPSRYWLDGFESDWWLEDSGINSICQTVPVAVVSPEIHGRDPRPVWTWFIEQIESGCDVVMCTDLPYDLFRCAR